MINEPQSAPWLGLLIWILMVTVCGALLMVRLAPRAVSSEKKQHIVRLAALSIGILFVIAVLRIASTTGNIQIAATMAVFLSLLWVGIWWLYRRVFKFG